MHTFYLVSDLQGWIEQNCVGKAAQTEYEPGYYIVEIEDEKDVILFKLFHGEDSMSKCDWETSHRIARAFRTINENYNHVIKHMQMVEIKDDDNV